MYQPTVILPNMIVNPMMQQPRRMPFIQNGPNNLDGNIINQMTNLNLNKFDQNSNLYTNSPYVNNNTNNQINYNENLNNNRNNNVDYDNLGNNQNDNGNEDKDDDFASQLYDIISIKHEE